MKRKMSEETKKKISLAMKKKKEEVKGLTLTMEVTDRQGRTIELKFENGILTGKV